MDSLRQRHFAADDVPSAPPPSYDEIDQCPPAVGWAPELLPEVPQLSHDKARQALLKELSWFSNKKPATEFEFVRMEPSRAFRYELSTFTEARATAWASKPYRGEPVDGPERGAEPGMWEVHVNAPPMFEDGEERTEVPHTASVRMCQECGGVGRRQCWKCQGSRSMGCAPCMGTGRIGGGATICAKCNGSGGMRCDRCMTQGDTQCDTCKGAGQVRRFRELTVTWKTVSVDRIVELTGIAHKCIRSAQGRKLLEYERIQAAPFTDFPVPAMNAASLELTSSHTAAAFPDKKVLMQRQRVFFVPVTMVTGTWNDKEFTYWVYGYNNATHCPHYPATPCDCSCTLI